MRRNPDEKIREVEDVLIAAHRGRVAAEPVDSFARDVMFQVRQMRAPTFEPIRNGTDSRTVWRFAFVSGLMALIFLAYSLNVDLSGIQFAQSVVGDPSTLMLAETLAAI